jgi:hypothetical protein
LDGKFIREEKTLNNKITRSALLKKVAQIIENDYIALNFKQLQL